MAIQLQGRQRECETLDRLVVSLRAGQSAALVLRGEAGIGKTALLDYVQTHPAASRVVRAAGVESELELPYGGLHQLCAQLGAPLSIPRYDALSTAFGLTPGDPPDRFLVGVSMLNLLTEVAEDEPLICLIDDAQWLDRVSTRPSPSWPAGCWPSGWRSSSRSVTPAPPMTCPACPNSS